MRRTFLLSLAAGIALGIAAGARAGRAEETSGSGGGGKSDRCIGLSATCASFRAAPGAAGVPRWCARRIAAPGAWPDAAATIDRLDVTPSAAAAGVRADLERASFSVETITAQCYREALAARPTVAGRVTLRLRFDPASKCPRRVDVVRDTAGDPHLARCAADSIYGLITTAHDGPAPISARLTLLFRRAPAQPQPE